MVPTAKTDPCQTSRNLPITLTVQLRLFLKAKTSLSFAIHESFVVVRLKKTCDFKYCTLFRKCIIAIQASAGNLDKNDCSLQSEYAFLLYLIDLDLRRLCYFHLGNVIKRKIKYLLTSKSRKSKTRILNLVAYEVKVKFEILEL